MEYDKKHYRRNSDGVVRYSPDSEGEAANLQQRTALGKHRDGSIYLRAADADDLGKARAIADTLGVTYRQRRAGASHFGRTGSYEHLHFDTPTDALNVHAALAYHLEKNGEAQGHDEHIAKLAAGLHGHIQGKDARVDGCMVNTRHAHAMSLAAGKEDTHQAHKSAADLHRLSAEAHRAQAARPWTKGEGAHHAGMAIMHDAIASQHDKKAMAAHKRIQAELKRQAEAKARMEAMEEGRETKKAHVEGDKYVMGLDEAIKEHEELVDTLKSPSKKDDEEEIEDQGGELAEMKEAKKCLGTVGAGTDLSTLEGGGALRAEGHDKEMEDATMGREVKKAKPSGSGVRTVYLDMDGVIANYELGAKQKGLDPSKAKDVAGFFRSLPVVEGAKQFVDDLVGRGIGVIVLSTPPKGRAAEAANEKREWLREHFPMLAEDAIFTQDKSAHGADDDLLVDDHPEWSNASNFHGAVLKFGGPKDWGFAQQAAVQEAGKVKDYVGREAKKGLDLDPLPEPTPGQIEAGNYKVHKVNVQGLEISIENPKGSIRRGVDRDGHEWESKMAHDYGYFRGAHSDGPDGDPVDVFVGPDLNNSYAHVVNQVDPRTGKFDEFKVMVGFKSREDAIDGYLANYEKGWKGLGDVKTMHLDDLKQWLKHGDLKHRLIYKAATVRLDNAARLQMQVLRCHPANRLSPDFLNTIHAAKSAGISTQEILRTISNATGAFAPLLQHLRENQ